MAERFANPLFGEVRDKFGQIKTIDTERSLEEIKRPLSTYQETEDERDQAKRDILCRTEPGRRERANKHVFYSIDTLENAIEQGRQVSFLYFDRMIDGQKVYRKEKTRYIVNPLSLVFTQDRYYLVGYNDKYMNYSGYRIDRMESLQIEQTPITPNEQCAGFNIYRYKKEG